ncbi:LacI family DNA-binding transcriptional regulator [Rhodococcoides corynebacterioides]|uniref:LacI family DNA-binding transcriptional regulator n=1 Tax=Rhodococcoides corynebacterioides TaxID=53972 RepID=A0ABS7P5V6_9NOCA|nr:LacI family DNA-binding transcriptional regulator [Rhodococcus corynebacterioides]MBY6366561.1 LacI family DNA-binding transcriptional regulator [Rhodococcus corynebacterioides]MBY6408070.1 LacI family DNA-binding transcriptional regulator [Rhodococcus corynebacterioides]
MATMGDVARLAGVSVSTVSHVLNETRKVNATTRERVESAIAQTGYRRNVVARSLAAGRTHTIGLSISALTNPYFGSLVHAIEERLSAAGLVMFLGDSHDDPAAERRVVDSLLDRQVDGIIVAPSADAERKTIPTIQANGTPFVLIDRGVEIPCDQVAPENVESAARLTDHLLDLGHRRIAVVRGLAGITSSTERADGFLRAMADRGVDVDPRYVLDGHSRVDAAEQAVRELLSAPDRPTAIVSLNNSMTIGTVKAARALGLDIPSDVALVSYDDFEWSDLFEPRLTAAGQDVGTMGRAAVDMLLERIDGYGGPARRVQVPTSFHHRNSCGC